MSICPFMKTHECAKEECELYLCNPNDDKDSDFGICAFAMVGYYCMERLENDD